MNQRPYILCLTVLWRENAIYYIHLYINIMILLISSFLSENLRSLLMWKDIFCMCTKSIKKQRNSLQWYKLPVLSNGLIISLDTLLIPPHIWSQQLLRWPKLLSVELQWFFYTNEPTLTEITKPIIVCLTEYHTYLLIYNCFLPSN